MKFVWIGILISLLLCLGPSLCPATDHAFESELTTDPVYRYLPEHEGVVSDDLEVDTWCCVGELCEPQRPSPFAELVRKFSGMIPGPLQQASCYQLLSQWWQGLGGESYPR